jgi:NitT/TauT family transport system substrate-binding protein
MTVVTFNLNPTITYGPLMIALGEGFLEEEGITPKLVSLDSNSGLAALTAGKLDVLSTGVRSSVFNVIQRGAQVQVVVGKGHDHPTCTHEAFVAPAEMAKRIAASGGSLRGERVAMVRGGVVEFLTIQLLASRGLTLDDVVAIPLPQGTPVSSRDGIDAIRYVNEPLLSGLLAEGETTVIATPEEFSPGHQSAFVLFGQRLLHDDPELGRRVMRAYIRGLRQWDEGATDRNVELLARYTKLPPEIIRGICWTTTRDDGRIDPRDVQPFLDWALEQGYLDEPITAAWWNPDFIDAAARSLDDQPR